MSNKEENFIKEIISKHGIYPLLELIEDRPVIADFLRDKGWEFVEYEKPEFIEFIEESRVPNCHLYKEEAITKLFEIVNRNGWDTVFKLLNNE